MVLQIVGRDVGKLTRGNVTSGNDRTGGNEAEDLTMRNDSSAALNCHDILLMSMHSND